MTPIKPYIHPDVAMLLSDEQLMFKAKELNSGPVHVQLPHIMDSNIAQFKKVVSSFGIDSKIYFAHKPTNVSDFVIHAKQAGIGIEVASYNEFQSAITNGFIGKEIIVTGVKDDRLLNVAILHGAIVSIDSLDELKTYQQLISEASLLKDDSRSVLLRIGEPKTVDRVVRARVSRFGMVHKDIITALKLIASYSQMELLGSHLHYYEANTDTYGAYMDYMVELVIESYNYGHQPHIIDIGGSWRKRQLNEYAEWTHFVEHIEVGLLQNSDTGTWRNHAYGMRLNHKGGVVGREKLQAKFTNEEYPQKLQQMLGVQSSRNPRHTILQLLTDLGMTLVVEPGMSLLDQCGISIVEVLNTKTVANGDNLVQVAGSMFQFSHGAFELFTDPILIKKDSNKDKNIEFSGYVVGNTCKEEDFLLTRKISWPHKPERGDLLVFINTAAYVSSFVNATPHQHDAGIHVIVQKEQSRYLLVS